MKRPALIIAILVVLVSIIGFERIGKGIRFLVSDERAAGARADGQAASSDVTKPITPSVEESESYPIAARSDNRGPADSIGSPPINEQSGEESVAVKITGEVSPIHFIRTSTIFGSSEPSDEQIDRMREAIDVIGDALRPSAVILDADGLSSSQSPALLFAREEFDLTDQVKAVYEAMEKASNSRSQADTKVQQADQANGDEPPN